MNKAWLVLLLVFLSACDARPVIAPANEPEVAEEAANAVPATRASSASASERLTIGEYRVAAADGADVNLPHAITLSVTTDEIRLASQCFTPRWTWRYSAGTLVTQSMAEPQCERSRYPAELAAEAVLAQPDGIARTSAGGLLVTGGGHSLLLFSQ